MSTPTPTPTPTPIDETPHRPVWARDAARRAERRREPSFKALILNLIVLGIVAAVVGFFAAPAVAFLGIRSAAQASDIVGLSKLIDYDAVRVSLRPQLSSRVEPLTPAPSILHDPIGAIRRQFEDHPIIPQPNVEGYLTPSALLGLTGGMGRVSSEPPLDYDPHFVLPHPAYWSVNRARLSVSRYGTTIFTFERRGPFQWKLVHVGLPPETPSR